MIHRWRGGLESNSRSERPNSEGPGGSVEGSRFAEVIAGSKVERSRSLSQAWVSRVSGLSPSRAFSSSLVI